MASEDAEFEKLRREYLFNDSELESEFFSVARSTTAENTLLGKLITLTLFRRFCTKRLLDVPFLFININRTMMNAMETVALKEMMRISPGDPDGIDDITKEIEYLYPKIPWMTKYFIWSTFPAVFGHFMAEEYSHTASIFIQNHIQDPLAPQLLGCFLLHGFNFTQHFLDALMEIHFEYGWDSIETLMDALERAAPYLTLDQVETVQKLREISESKACQAVCRYFLAKAVKLCRCWRLMKLANFGENLVSQLKSLKPEDEETQRILGIFRPDVVTELPRVSSVAYYGGVGFTVSEIDVAFIQHFMNCKRKLSGHAGLPLKVNLERVSEDAFTIRKRFAQYPSETPTKPTPTETQSGITKKRLLDRKAMHDFLFQNSGEIPDFMRASNALKWILRLATGYLAQVMGSIDSPCEFLFDHYTGYALRLFVSLTPAYLHTYIGKEVQGPAEVAHEQELRKALGFRMVTDPDPAHAELASVTDYMDQWKRKYCDSMSQPQATPTDLVKSGEDVFCEHYIELLHNLGTELILNCLPQNKETPFGILQGLDVEKRADALRAMVKDNLDKDVDDGIDEHSVEFPIGEEFRHEVVGLMNAMNDKAKAEFEGGVEHCVSDWILSFLTLEELLEPIVEEDLVYVTLPMKGAILLGLFSQEPMFFLGMLLDSMIEVRQLLSGMHGAVPGLATISNPFKVDFQQKFAKLAMWFGFGGLDSVRINPA